MSKVFEDRNFVKEFIEIIINIFEYKEWNKNDKSDCIKIKHYVDYLLTDEYKKKITNIIINYNKFPTTLFFLLIINHLEPGNCLHGILQDCTICNVDYEPNNEYDADINKIISQHNNRNFF